MFGNKTAPKNKKWRGNKKRGENNIIILGKHRDTIIIFNTGNWKQMTTVKHMLAPKLNITETQVETVNKFIAFEKQWKQAQDALREINNGGNNSHRVYKKAVEYVKRTNLENALNGNKTVVFNGVKAESETIRRYNSWTRKPRVWELETPQHKIVKIKRDTAIILYDNGNIALYRGTRETEKETVVKIPVLNGRRKIVVKVETISPSNMAETLRYKNETYERDEFLRNIIGKDVEIWKVVEIVK